MSKCICGKPIRNTPGRGRKRSYCSDACKAKAYRERGNYHEIVFRDDLGQDTSLNRLYHGHALSVLKTIEENSIDCLVTDPPYGYSFMGKDWDKAVPSVEIWKDCLRVLKPGAFAFIMSSPRQDVLSHMIIRLSEAGFCTDFTSLYWAYASGFPKALNIGKMVDKKLGADREVVEKSVRKVDWHNLTYNVGSNGEDRRDITKPATEQAKALDGSYGGFQPKPAVEVILVCMKPLSEKTFVDQALQNGKGVTWLDDCRIPYEYEDIPKEAKEHISTVAQFPTNRTNYQPSEQGRFPANLLVSDDALNDGRITKSTGYRENKGGILNTGSTYGAGIRKNNWFGSSDSGSFSRYFDLDKWAQKTFPFLIVSKASKREKGQGNTHPTVKPLKLMSYLITLGSREGDCILDPFMGTGTTCLSALLLGRSFIGIELDADYISLASQRLEQAGA